MVLVVFLVVTVLRIVWLPEDNADKVEAAIYFLLLGLLVLFLFYPPRRGPSDSD